MCAMFTGERDVSLVRLLNRELMGNIITQQAAFYKYKVRETKVNIYGEADAEKYYEGPYLFNCLIDRGDKVYTKGEVGVDLNRKTSFFFLRDDLFENSVYPEMGDIILYEDSYYNTDSVIENQYWGGKNPDYPNNPNPLNSGLEKFSTSLSIQVVTHLIPSDKVAISPSKERF
jgi:hypothetical protein